MGMPIWNHPQLRFPNWITNFTNNSESFMGNFHTNILMVEIKENGIRGYAIVLSSYYHIKSISVQNHNIISNLMTGGSHNERL